MSPNGTGPDLLHDPTVTWFFFPLVIAFLVYGFISTVWGGRDD